MIKPSIGRVCWYRPIANEGLVTNGGEPLAAHICGINRDPEEKEEDTVNLVVFDFKGQVSNRTNVKLIQAGDPAPARPYAEWMPYQIGQAAKTEEVQAELDNVKRGPGRPRKDAA